MEENYVVLSFGYIVIFVKNKKPIEITDLLCGLKKRIGIVNLDDLVYWMPFGMYAELYKQKRVKPETPAVILADPRDNHPKLHGYLTGRQQVTYVDITDVPPEP